VSVLLLLALCNFGVRVGTRAQKELQNSTALRHTSLSPLITQIPMREPNFFFFTSYLYVVMAEAASKPNVKCQKVRG